MLTEEAYLQTSETATMGLIWEIINSQKLLTIFAKKLHRGCLIGFYIRPWIGRKQSSPENKVQKSVVCVHLKKSFYSHDNS